MKNIILLLCLFISLNCDKSDPLDVEIYKLDNGLTVMLNEDHNEASVFGAVVVDGGSKRDPSDATGIAHYLEHLLFKGTKDLGTVDYDSEKKYLDSIEVLYEQLGLTKKDNKRLQIQKEINRLSIKASEYAIPNEFTQLIDDMGGTGLNAGTGDDFIYYFNSFPSTQIEKWMEIYSHRFLEPVFRLFQAELEIVYEEKNRSMDNPGRAFYDTFQKYFYKNHPYGQQSRIGTVEHLKNPSLKKMKEYFEKFYVANNMYLIIAGDFNKRDVKKIIKKKFGRLRKGKEIDPLNIDEDQFKGREVADVSILPYRVARIGYRTVIPSHPDALVLDVIQNIFNNSSRTGLLDKLNADNKILSASAYSIGGKDHGGFGFGFVPKDDNQSFDEAEGLILNAIKRVKDGNFDDETLESIKLNMKMSHETRMESLSGRLWLIMSVVLEDIPWNDTKTYPERVDEVSKDQIVKVANRYLNDNYLILRSEKGEHEKVKLKKPPFKPVEPKNSETKSEYAKSLDKIKPGKIVPRFVDFKKDLQIEDLRKNLHFYHVKNPINSIFSLGLQFGMGTIENPSLAQASQFISLIGTKEKTFDQFKEALQKIGSKIEVYSNSNYFGYSISGFDAYLSETLDLLNEFMTNMHVRPDDVNKLEKLVESSKITREREVKNPSTIGRALKDFVMYGEKSPFLRRSSINEVKKMTPDFLIAQVNNAMNYELDISYTGTLQKSEVIALINDKLIINDSLIASKSPITIDYKKHTRNKVFLIDDPKAVQSQIYILSEGKVLDPEQRNIATVFNKYFGRGMASIIFQEIREFRSLAYTARGYYVNTPDIKKPGYFYGYMGTQVDKTMEAISTYIDLFQNLPVKENRLASIKSNLTESINGRKPSWRNRGSYVINMTNLGYIEDPNKYAYEVYNEVEFQDILDFHNYNIVKDPLVITIVTDRSKINIDKILDYGELIELDKEKIFN